MSVLFPDTHPQMEALQIQLWRQASPTRKMNMLAQCNKWRKCWRLWDCAPNIPRPARPIRRRLAGLLLGEVAARKVYGEISHAK